MARSERSQEVRVRKARVPFPSSLDAATAFGESRNRDIVNGRPVQSSAGALYAMQVLPSTAQKPGFGVRPAVNNTPAEFNRVGRDYRAAMQQRYGGDLAKMWAAYNWGVKNLDAAIRQYGDNWLQAAPQETRDYIARNFRALGGR